MKKAFEILKNDIKRLWLPLIIIVVYFAVTILIFGEVCPMLIATDFPCPACGLTRAAFSLILLDPVSAWAFNPAIFLWIPLLLATLILHLKGKRTKPMIPFGIITVFATIAIYVLRILGCMPGSPLQILYSSQIPVL